MKTVLAIVVDPKVAPEIAEHAGRQAANHGGRWREQGLYIHLAGLDPLDAVEEDGPLARALAKAANAQQGFKVTIRGLKFDGRQAYLAVQKKAGMLQSVADSVAGRLPDASAFHFDEPWKPMLVVADFDKSPSDRDKLRIEAAWTDREWQMPVKEIAILNVGDADLQTLISAKLTSSGG